MPSLHACRDSTRQDKNESVKGTRLVFYTLDLFSYCLEVLGDMSVNQSRVKGNKSVSNVLSRYRRFLHESVSVYTRAYFVSFTSPQKSQRLPDFRFVLVLSRSSRRHVVKSVPSQRKQECLECLVSLSTILARECECLHSCVLRLIYISPKVTTSIRDENVNQASKISLIIFQNSFSPEVSDFNNFGP